MKFSILLLLPVFLFNCCKGDAPVKESPAAAKEPSAAVTVPPDDSLICVTGVLYCQGAFAQLYDPKYKRMYKLVDNTGTLFARNDAACLPVKYPGETTHAVLCGTGISRDTSPISNIQKFTIFRIDTVVAKTAENVGMPFEFWCRGTNPTWDVEVSNLGGGLFYQNEGDGTGWFCAWTPPVVSGNKWTYTIPAAPGMNEALTLVIKKEIASDGRTDKKYDYSAELTVKGKKLKGAAIRGTGLLMGPRG